MLKLIANGLNLKYSHSQRHLILLISIDFSFIRRTWTEQLKEVGRRPSLLRAIATTFWREYFLLGFWCLINDVLIRIIQPQLLRHFLLYFKYVWPHLLARTH